MKKIIFIVIFIFSVLIINNLVRSIWNLLNKQNILISTQSELDKEKQENKKLRQQLSEATSPGFLEEEARNKLLMVKPNEQQVIISGDLIKASDSAGKKIQIGDKRSNWQKWWDLFF